jgi:hypothetical protein
MKEIILTYLQQNDIQYFFSNEEKTLVRFGVSTEKAQYPCLLDIVDSENRFIFFTFFPVYIPENIRIPMAKLLMRINYDIFLGSFEMDFIDGEMRFKTSIIYENVQLTEKMLEHLIKGNISTLDSYFQVLNEFIFGRLTLEDSIKQLSHLE